MLFLLTYFTENFISFAVYSLACFITVTSSSGVAPLTPAELSTLSPTAAATSSFLKSGMTLTQVCTCFNP